MDKNIAIEFNNVGKQYRLGLVGTGSLQHDLNRWWQTTVMRREDPYLKIGEVNDRSVKGNSDYVWALKDISFKVEQGDVVGIIGKNGAGKSTLLKLLSHITAPTVGDIRYRGRIASLLEVGTGFHPEMTARQNIYMNGSIMGMTRHEIDRKLDEIVDFAGIERYLDTPVKRFSSGMTVRLGFAVAAFLEPEILVVDEVLAVGDAEFQKKAIGKMKDVSSGGGRTVLFVSHNMASIKALCTNGILLENGMLKYSGNIIDVINEYTAADCNSQNQYFSDITTAPGNDFIKVKSFEILPLSGDGLISIESGINFRVCYVCTKSGAMLDVNMDVSLLDSTKLFQLERPFGRLDTKDSGCGTYTVDFIVPPYTLNAGNYLTSVWFGEDRRTLLYKGLRQKFEVFNSSSDMGANHNNVPGLLRIKNDHKIVFEENKINF